MDKDTRTGRRAITSGFDGRNTFVVGRVALSTSAPEAVIFFFFFLGVPTGVERHVGWLVWRAVRVLKAADLELLKEQPPTTKKKKRERERVNNAVLDVFYYMYVYHNYKKPTKKLE